MNHIVGLSGGIASGKTTVGVALAAGIPGSFVCSFGDVVSARTLSEGLPLVRSELQRVGAEMIAEGWSGFVDSLLAAVPLGVRVLIVDGIRHVEPLDELRRRYPDSPMTIVFLRSKSGVVEARMTARNEAPTALSHKVEASVGDVERIADVIVEAGSEIEDAVRQIRQAVDAKPQR